jgi:hypothetical protein
MSPASLVHLPGRLTLATAAIVGLVYTFGGKI